MIMLMKNFLHYRYRFYKPDQKEHKIFAISDVHFSENVVEQLDRVAEKAESEQPQLITISGDLVDCIDKADEPKERARLSAWLTRLGKIAPVCLCLGNHDFYKMPPDFKSGLSKDHHYVAGRNDHIIKFVNDIENVHLLDDASFENDEFYVFGLTLPPSYYQFDQNPGREDVNILLEKLDDLSNFCSKLPKRKTKILLTHSPVHLLDEPVKEKLSEFDFRFAGHMHNGVVPPFLNEIWRGHRGIMSPTKRFFQDDIARTGLYDDQLIVLGAVSTIQKGAGRLAALNRAFPINIATIETSHNDVYARKTDIHKKYESFKH